MDWLPEALRPLLAIPHVPTLLGLAGLILAAVAADRLLRALVNRLAGRLVEASSFQWDDALLKHRVFSRLVHVVPAWILHAGIGLVPGLPEGLVTTVRNVAAASAILAIAFAINNLLNALNELYDRYAKRAQERPIKGWLQVVQLVVFVFAGVLMIAALIDRSPLLLLSGLGAMTAVLMLVFKDTLLSLVASVQISSQDLLRRGDWIEMPSAHADGDVIDIALHTIRVQNWDKTITSIPTHRLISDSFKNWRGMKESGGRRIKRALLIDQTSVRFLTDGERDGLRRFALIDGYLDGKRTELEAYNKTLLEGGKDPVNTRRVTNLGTFRAYMQAYLGAHARVHQGMFQLVRQLAPEATGIPLEVYCFSASVAWADYESLQADLFDHFLAVMPEFGLRVYQQPSGADLRSAMGELTALTPRAVAPVASPAAPATERNVLASAAVPRI